MLYAKLGSPLAVPSLLFIKTTIKNICFYGCPLPKMIVSGQNPDQGECGQQSHPRSQAQELEHFFKEACKFKNISLFSICKFIDLSTLKSRWSLRYNDITNTSTLRNNKIDSLINI